MPISELPYKPDTVDTWLLLSSLILISTPAVSYSLTPMADVNRLWLRVLNGTCLSSLSCVCRGPNSNPLQSDSQAHLFFLHGAESQKSKAGGDRTLSSEHLGMTFLVLVGDISLRTQTAKEPWVWDSFPWQKWRQLFPAAKTEWGVTEPPSLASHPTRPRQQLPLSRKLSCLVSTAWSLSGQERGQILSFHPPPPSRPLPAGLALYSWPPTQIMGGSLTISI